MDQLLSDAKHLVQRLNAQENIFDSVISETITLQRRLSMMKQYHDEVSRMNDLANHRPRCTLILGSLVENQKIQNLEQENKELSLSLAEHQSALELIMNKYREQVLIMMKLNSSQKVCHNNVCLETEVKMREKISEMANVMRQSALIDDSLASKEIEVIRCLQVENENLRELLQISGKSYQTYFPSSSSNELFNSTNSSSLSLNKSNLFDHDILSDTSFLKNKDSGIFENEIVDSNSNKDVVLPKKSNNFYDFHNSLEQLNINHDSNFNMELRSHLDEEPTMNCFRAIITNIQPLDVSKDESSNNSEVSMMNSNNLSDDVFSENHDSYNFLPKRKKHLIKQSFKETLQNSDNPLAYLFTQTEKKNELVKKDCVQLNDIHYESDADSELTFVGDDIDAALSELDSIVDNSIFLEDEDNF
ncbi:uncharacterized protein LOC100210588 [Hydra vulgaris]|uniref:uncharacterized protein LOC100210588 n=1 Tax=Hydra vulgaris TaxID=6087 RepID=UPI001F5E6B67|nr:uncharacterized protein LOC100210588 [Hydra vulgaris]